MVKVSYTNTIIKISFCLCTLLLSSCDERRPKENVVSFNIPSQEVHIVYNDSSGLTLKEFLSSSPYKCMIFLEGDCGACLSNLSATNNFLKELKNIPSVFVIRAKSMKTFNAFSSLHGLDIKTIQDASDIIREANKFINANFILLNQKNEVVTQGNPIEQPEIKKLYRKFNREKV